MADVLPKFEDMEPTFAHKFCKLLRDKDLLLKYFSTNQDNLEEQTGWQKGDLKLVHASHFSAYCVNENCKKLKKQIENSHHHLNQKCESCKEYLKSNVTYFGEAIPFNFKLNEDDEKE